MSQRASQVVRLLEELKRLSLPIDQIPKELPAPNGASDEHRPPKRPWQDVSREDGGVASGGHRQEVHLDGLLLHLRLLTPFDLVPRRTEDAIHCGTGHGDYTQ